MVALAIISFAMPIPEWRTGELPAPPLPVVEGGPAVHMPNRIWIDTDAACGHSRTTDPDDCFALLLLIRAHDMKVAGISTVHGNASIDITDRTTRELVSILEREGASVSLVYRGSGRASDEAAPDAPPASPRSASASPRERPAYHRRTGPTHEHHRSAGRPSGSPAAGGAAGGGDGPKVWTPVSSERRRWRGHALWTWASIHGFQL